MTLPATPFRKDHTLTGAIVPLLYDWKVENKSHLLVTLVNTSVTPNVETTLAVDTDYAVSGVGNDAGGNVTPTTAYTAGWKIAITSNVPYEQDTDFTNQNSVLPEEAESMADKIGRQVKQIVEVLSRCVKTTVGGGIQPDDLLDAINDAVALSGTNATQTAADVVTTGNNATAAQAAQSAAESAAAGIKWRPSVRAATTAALPSVTYNNGASGVGATLTATANGAFPTIDGVAAALNNDYLIKDQAAGLQNGVYRLTQVGTGGTPFILTRRTDADTWLELVSQAVIIEEGTTLADQAYICTVNQGGTIGTTGVTWGTFSPPLVIASQAEAEAGAENTKAMSSLRVYQQVTARIASLAQMIAGTANLIVSAANFKAWLDTKYVLSAVVTAATGSALSLDFNAPAGMTPKRVTIFFNGLVINGSDTPVVQLGDAGGIETTGYLAVSGGFNTSTPNSLSSGSGFLIAGTSATNSYQGKMTFELMDATNNKWICNGMVSYDGSLTNWVMSGLKALSQPLDRIRLRSSGTNQASAGNISVLWEG